MRFFYPHSEYKENYKKIIPKLHRFLLSGNYVLGSYVRQFEKKIESLLNNKKSSKKYEAIGVSNGTDALKIILRMINIQGYEVLLSPFTFISVPNTIAELGGIPVFIDINKTSYDMDIEKIEAYVKKNSQKKIKAIIFTHLFGMPSVNSPYIEYFQNQKNIYTIEDACQSFYATYENQFVGTFADFTFFSFYPTKIFSAYGDAGLILSSRFKETRVMKKIRNQGNQGQYFGYNARLDEIQALLLLLKWNSFLKNIEKNRLLGSIYQDHLSKYSRIFSQNIPMNPVYPFFTLELENRNHYIALLKERNIPSRIYYPHLYPQKNWVDKKKIKIPYPLTESRKLCQSQLSIPLSIDHSIENIETLFTLFP